MTAQTNSYIMVEAPTLEELIEKIQRKVDMGYVLHEIFPEGGWQKAVLVLPYEERSRRQEDCEFRRLQIQVMRAQNEILRDIAAALGSLSSPVVNQNNAERD